MEIDLPVFATRLTYQALRTQYDQDCLFIFEGVVHKACIAHITAYEYGATVDATGYPVDISGYSLDLCDALQKMYFDVMRAARNKYLDNLKKLDAVVETEVRRVIEDSIATTEAEHVE